MGHIHRLWVYTEGGSRTIVIDVHVHLRDGAQAAKETIAHGFRVAAMCGIDALFDMPNTAIPLTTAQAIRERIEFGRSKAKMVSREIGRALFYGVYGGVTSDPLQIEEMVHLYGSLHPSMVGLKMFAGHSTGHMGLLDEYVQRSVYERLASLKYRGVLAVHCEKESVMRPDLWDPTDPATHCLARPAEAEVASVADQIEFARTFGFRGTLHICHISTAGAIELVNSAKRSGMSITCGATAHHALLDESVAGRSDNLSKMNPPLRSAEDRMAVFEGLVAGTVDWMESDHAPHTIGDKQSGASGIPGFAGTALLINALRDAGVEEALLLQLCGGRAKSVYQFDWPVNVPTRAQLENVLPMLRESYPWDPFLSLVG